MTWWRRGSLDGPVQSDIPSFPRCTPVNGETQQETKNRLGMEDVMRGSEPDMSMSPLEPNDVLRHRGTDPFTRSDITAPEGDSQRGPARALNLDATQPTFKGGLGRKRSFPCEGQD